MEVTGYISGYDGHTLELLAPFEDSQFLERRDVTQCRVILEDGRTVSPVQRNKIFALIADITRYVSGVSASEGARYRIERNEILRSLQLSYLMDYADREEVREQITHCYCQLIGRDIFSLSDCDMSTARDFIDYLVELCVMHGIPCTDTLLSRCEDSKRYLYACVMNRRCAVCGQKADIHEYDRVGAGRNRSKIHHKGQRVQPLCRAHHREVDAIGQKTFDEKYHMTWVELDEAACKKLNWRI